MKIAKCENCKIHGKISYCDALKKQGIVCKLYNGDGKTPDEIISMQAESIKKLLKANKSLRKLLQ